MSVKYCSLLFYAVSEILDYQNHTQVPQCFAVSAYWKPKSEQRSTTLTKSALLNLSNTDKINIGITCMFQYSISTP
jgi:hypothetical protein